MRDLVRRIDAATPPGRDRTIDALRALAVLGVVLGHWLVTALVTDSGRVHGSSPLTYMPELAPASWVFQTLAVFFLVGGSAGARSHASARARGVPYGRWLGARTARLSGPVVALLVVWTVVAGMMLASGAGPQTVRTLSKLVLSPLWFLLVFVALTAATPLLGRLHPLWPTAVVLHVDLVRFGLDGPAWLGWINVAAGWLVPYSVGVAWARGGMRSPAAGWTMLLGGAGATLGLVLWAGYPVSMVGVPGAEISNLDPPTLAAVTFGTAQCGAAVLLLGRLRRVLRRPAVWAAVALVNLSAMTIFLWHQTAMIAVTAIGLLGGGHLPGLHTVPEGPGWIPARLAWLPVFAGALVVCWAAFRAYERPRQRTVPVTSSGGGRPARPAGMRGT
ncbi:acyltransferase family protein [Streptomyces sp. SP18CS02]|uniref:acyltransferase family protein n=1 Tax=Streptomyces sp. SP18CS02 TaxID=3002531 RepID=UPI002E7A9828|nr:acyltransferase [Streptomyces sp. SP18CS02]MEE1753174.1 acyltransferase [Streptomyces sp. SP18CS02]